MASLVVRVYGPHVAAETGEENRTRQHICVMVPPRVSVEANLLIVQVSLAEENRHPYATATWQSNALHLSPTADEPTALEPSNRQVTVGLVTVLPDSSPDRAQLCKESAECQHLIHNFRHTISGSSFSPASPRRRCPRWSNQWFDGIGPAGGKLQRSALHLPVLTAYEASRLPACSAVATDVSAATLLSSSVGRIHRPIIPAGRGPHGILDHEQSVSPGSDVQELCPRRRW